MHHNFYPAIAAIVAEECAKQGVPYSSYPSLAAIGIDCLRYMRDMGTAEQLEGSHTAGLVGRI